MDKIINIFIIEDDNDINQLITNSLKNNINNFNTYSAYSGTEALIVLKDMSFDLIILDLMLPGLFGEDVLIKIREKSNTPIIVISAITDKQTKLKILDMGADDYIVKPFDIDEMKSRINAVLRRYKNTKQIIEKNICYKNMLIEPASMDVFINQKKLNLTVREYEILKLFMENPNKVFSRTNIYETLWNETYMGDDTTVNVHISNLRAKIHKIDDTYEYIKTVWGIGFKMN